jgi:hypothetical protein
MKTTLLTPPTSQTIKQLDVQISNYITKIQTEISNSMEKFGYSAHEGHDSVFAILETPYVAGEKLKPYRTITVEGMSLLIDTGLKLEELGFTCINKDDIYPTQGFDCIFVLE